MMLTIRSYAKINLSLDILGRLDNGYHIISSVLSYIDLYDIMQIEEASKSDVTVAGQFRHQLDISRNRNIILKTISYMHKKYGVSENFHVKLYKNIPIGAGMGGGSSNAANIMLFINDYSGLHLPQDQIIRDAIQIGADVSFFTQQSSAICNGIGHLIEPININWEDSYVLIVNPMINASTIDVYKSLRTEKIMKNYSTSSQLQNRDSIGLNEIFSFIKKSPNDLTSHACKLYPYITTLLYQMHDIGLNAKMSGSGSTCFAIVKDRELAQLACSAIYAQNPLYFIRYFKMIDKIKRQKIMPKSEISYKFAEQFA